MTRSVGKLINTLLLGVFFCLTTSDVLAEESSSDGGQTASELRTEGSQNHSDTLMRQAKDASSIAAEEVSVVQSQVDGVSAGVSRSDGENIKLSYTKTSQETGSQLLTVLLSLVFIIALIYALSLFVRKFGQGMGYSSQHIKPLANLSVGTRERVSLISVGNKQILIGITPTQINTLHVFDEPIVDVEKTPAAGQDFAQKLKAVLAAQTQKHSEK